MTMRKSGFKELKLRAWKSEIAGSNPTLAFKFDINKIFFPALPYRFNIGESLCVTNLESCFWRAVSSHSSHHRQEVLPAQFSNSFHGGQVGEKRK